MLVTGGQPLIEFMNFVKHMTCANKQPISKKYGKIDHYSTFPKMGIGFH
jgi:hypothetical protein